MTRLLSVAVCFYVVAVFRSPLTQGQLVSEVTFTDCSHQLAMDAIADFAENRASWMDFVTSGTAKIESESVGEQGIDGLPYSVEIESLYLQDASRRLSRQDSRRDFFRDDFVLYGTWRAKFTDGEKVVRTLEGSSQELPVSIGMNAVDPWNSTLCYLQKIERGECDSDSWHEILDERKLLHAQCNVRFLRTEWKLGTNPRLRLSVYFDRQRNNVPVFVKYHHPVDLNVAFDERTKEFRSEIRSVWAEVDGHWFAKHVRHHEETYKPSGSVRSRKEAEFEFSFHGSASTRPDLFEPFRVTSQQLADDLRRPANSRTER